MRVLPLILKGNNVAIYFNIFYTQRKRKEKICYKEHISTTTIL